MKEGLKAGDYIVSDRGEKYCFLDDPQYQEGKRLFIGIARVEGSFEKCFLKFVRLDEASQVSLVNMKRESQFRFFYPFIEHVYELFQGVDSKGYRLCGVRLEYVEGVDLEDYMAVRRQELEEGFLEEREYEEQIFRQILEFLHGVNYYLGFARAEYLHRDLKPKNVMITPQGDVVIVDFDIAHISGSGGTENFTEGYHLGGTRGYADPRTVREGRFDHWSEIYSAGRVLFYFLNGKHYYREEEILGETAAESPFYLDLKLGYGFRKDRFLEKYQGKRYDTLRRILERMCCDVGNGGRYGQIPEVIRDFKRFLLEEYYHNDLAEYERLLQTENAFLLQTRAARTEETSPFVVHRILRPGEAAKGHNLLEYSMRDILVDGRNVMTIYNLGGTVYYIPGSGTVRKTEGEKEDYIVHSQDIFLADEVQIQFIIG